MCSHQQIPERLKDEISSSYPSKNQGTAKKAPESSQTIKGPDPHDMPDGSGSEPAVIEKLKPSPPKGYISKWQDGQWIFVQDPRWSGGLFHGSAMDMNIMANSPDSDPVRPRDGRYPKFSTGIDIGGIGGGRGRSRGQKHTNFSWVHQGGGR
jgi:hypothetical protein